jgi:hypothetical protein
MTKCYQNILKVHDINLIVQMDDMDILKKTYSINLFEIFSKRIKNKKKLRLKR